MLQNYFGRQSRFGLWSLNRRTAGIYNGFAAPGNADVLEDLKSPAPDESWEITDLGEGIGESTS
jgi:hypothetical protein